jgi:hypothetical protein
MQPRLWIAAVNPQRAYPRKPSVSDHYLRLLIAGGLFAIVVTVAKAAEPLPAVTVKRHRTALFRTGFSDATEKITGVFVLKCPKTDAKSWRLTAEQSLHDSHSLAHHAVFYMCWQSSLPRHRRSQTRLFRASTPETAESVLHVILLFSFATAGTRPRKK